MAQKQGRSEGRAAGSQELPSHFGRPEGSWIGARANQGNALRDRARQARAAQCRENKSTGFPLMNLIQPSLRRPFTVIVLIIGVLLAALFGLKQMPRDIFPALGIPTIY